MVACVRKWKFSQLRSGTTNVAEKGQRSANLRTNKSTQSETGQVTNVLQSNLNGDGCAAWPWGYGARAKVLAEVLAEIGWWWHKYDSRFSVNIFRADFHDSLVEPSPRFPDPKVCKVICTFGSVLHKYFGEMALKKKDIPRVRLCKQNDYGKPGPLTGQINKTISIGTHALCTWYNIHEGCAGVRESN